MTNQEEIKRILDNDETIELSYKPNKMRYILIGGLAAFIPALLFCGLFLLFGILTLTGVWQITNEDGTPEKVAPVFMIIIGGLPLLLALLNLSFRGIRYKKLGYYVTNKRLIVQSGLIGIDYRSLDLASVAVMNVRVDFLDKIVHPNTGTISFGSAASPLITNSKTTNTNSAGLNVFSFQFINDPYETYKAIKERIPNK